jgi:hypothetical protein
MRRACRRFASLVVARSAAIVLAAVGLVGCMTSGYTYVANDDLGTYFRVPADFTVYDPDEVLEPMLADRPDVDLDAVLEQRWAVAFDGNEEPVVDRFLGQIRDPSEALAGYAQVRLLSPQERLGYSLQSLRSELISADQVQRLGDRLEVLDVQEHSEDGGEGLKLTFAVNLPDGRLVFDQMAVVDDETSRVFLLALGCSSDCYENNRDTINDIIESWTIEER